MGDTAQPDVPIMINLPFVEATTPDTTHQSTTSATNAFLELDLTILERIASHLDFHTALSLSTAHSRVRDAAERELGRLVDIEQPLKEWVQTTLPTLPLTPQVVQDSTQRYRLSSPCRCDRVLHRYLL